MSVLSTQLQFLKNFQNKSLTLVSPWDLFMGILGKISSGWGSGGGREVFGY